MAKPSDPTPKPKAVVKRKLTGAGPNPTRKMDKAAWSPPKRGKATTTGKKK